VGVGAGVVEGAVVTLTAGAGVGAGVDVGVGVEVVPSAAAGCVVSVLPAFTLSNVEAVSVPAALLPPPPQALNNTVAHALDNNRR
jgi:hypothetical protein